MSLSLLEKYGFIEPTIRVTLDKFPQIKKMAKKLRGGSGNKGEKTEEIYIDPAIKDEYFDKINSVLETDDVVLIHSSMDGLESIGITAEEFIEFLKDLIAKKNITVVMPCFPITNLKLPTPKSRPYNPKKTLCWTGMLPNTFLGDKDTIRTDFPYNSLAVMGPKADEFVKDNLDAIYVYDKTSVWRKCLEHKAKILFVGVKASGSNTMAIHMVPDVMGDDWPVENWYEDRTYKISIDGEIIEKDIKVQQDFWYRYCMEERTSGRLKERNILVEELIGGCNLGIVKDCSEMVENLIDLCNQGKLMYKIPKKYLRK